MRRTMMWSALLAALGLLSATGAEAQFPERRRARREERMERGRYAREAQREARAMRREARRRARWRELRRTWRDPRFGPPPPAPTAIGPAMREELRRHARRTARLERIAMLARRTDRPLLLARVEAALAAENRRHRRAMRRIRWRR